jgi:hypothetical protein
MGKGENSPVRQEVVKRVSNFEDWSGREGEVSLPLLQPRQA